MAKKNKKTVEELGYINDLEYFLKKAKLIKNDIHSLEQLQILVEAEIARREHINSQNLREDLKEKYGVE
jgi:hypothetical protein